MYSDLLDAFSLPHQPVSMFHMGGDEVNFDCWARDEGILEWLHEHKYPIEPERVRTSIL